MNTCFQFFILGLKFVDHMVILYLSEEPPNCFNIKWCSCIHLYSHRQSTVFQFLYILTNTYYFLFPFLKNYSYPNECKVVFHCGFALNCPNDKWCWASFHVLIDHCLFKSSTHFEIELCVLCCWVVRVLFFNTFYFYFILFIYLFCLRWVFTAVHGLSLVAASGGYSLLRCTGFSLWWLLLLWGTGSRRTGFSSCGSRAQ